MRRRNVRRPNRYTWGVDMGVDMGGVDNRRHGLRDEKDSQKPAVGVLRLTGFCDSRGFTAHGGLRLAGDRIPSHASS